jgi:predicted AlkP superfamily pyrophosphatase or phosphodiesterase
MLPAAPKDVGRLSDVFVSALASIGGGVENRLRLPKVRHSVVILVDGLGFENLKQAPAYSRFLNEKLNLAIRCEFPSTTATSITGFATGRRSSEHGVIGYAVFDSISGRSKNLLTGWESQADAESFKLEKSLSEKAIGVRVNTVGPKAYERSGFTELTMKNANYVVADKIADRFSALERLLASEENSLTYLYVPELDQAAHKFGVDSTNWLHLLEELDLTVNRFCSKLKGDVGILLTSDHGVIDVPQSEHIFLDEFDWYVSSVLHTAGDPRCNFVYLAESEDLETFLQKAKNEFGSAAYICTLEDLTSTGWTGSFTEKTRKYMPDLFVIWQTRKVAYDRRFAKAHHMQLVGQHGGISDTETRVPLIRLGKY